MFTNINPLKWRTSTKALWISFLLPIVIMLTYFASRHMAPFGSSSILTVDLGQQYIDFYAGFRQTVLHDPLRIFYDFSKGLGGETYGDWAYYLLSPTNFLLLPFSNVHLPAAILLLTVLKYGLAGWSFAFALRKMHWQIGWRLPLFAVSYAFMGWFVANDLNLLWLDAAILLPLIVTGLEYYLTHEKGWPFVLALTAVIIINYYMAYMIGIFLILYFIWRLTWQPYRLKERLTMLRRFILGGVISIGLATFVWLPTAYTLMNSKGQHMLANLSWKFDYQPADIIGKLFLGTFNFEQMPTGLPNIFIGSLPIIILWFFFTLKNIRWQTRLTALIITAILVISMMYAPLNLLWHGFQFPVWYPYRFSYLFSFWILWLVASVWSPYLRLSWSQFLTLLILTSGGFIYLFSRMSSLNFLTTAQLYIGGGFFIVLLLLHVMPAKIKFWLPIVTLLVIGEMTTSTVWTLNNFSYLTNTEYQTYIRSLNAITKDLPKSKTDFYRVAQSFQRTKGDPLQGNFNGASTFSSALEHQQSDIMAALGQPEGDNYIAYSSGTLMTDSLLGMRYLLQPTGSQPAVNGTPTNMQTYSRSDTNGTYRLVKQTKQVILSQNPNALPLGFAASDNVRNVKFKENDPLRNQNILWESLNGYNQQPIFTSANFSKSSASNLNAPSTITGAYLTKTNAGEGASLTLTYVPTSNNPYYLTLGNAVTNDNLEIQLNGQTLPAIPSHRHTIIVPLPADTKGQSQEITLSLKKKDIWLQNVSLYQGNKAQLNRQSKSLQQHPYKIKHQSPIKISGDITIPKNDSMMMTTIPKAAGWQVYVDGKATDTVTVGKFFIGVPLEPGHHEVTFKFKTPLFKLGAIITLGFLLIIMGFKWSESKKRQHTLF